MVMLRRALCCGVLSLGVACSSDDQASRLIEDMGAQSVDMRVVVADMLRDVGADEDADMSKDSPEMSVISEEMGAAEEMGVVEMIYQGGAPLYLPGALEVEQRAATGAPVDVQLYVPKAAGQYPVVVFQHGFLMATTHYSALLRHVASHGFVVVAPQMYAPGGLPLGKPSTTQEAETARRVLGWVREQLQAQLPGVVVRADRMGLVGHSRGGKVIWRLLLGGEQPQAVVGVDPVDGTGGPLGGDSRVVAGMLPQAIPTLIIGTGLGPNAAGAFQPACAPQGDNHEQFYADVRSPAYHVVLKAHGHLDMLDDNPQPCGLECTACPAGPSRAPARAAVAGMIVALLREQLQGVEAAAEALKQPVDAGVPVEASFK